MGSSPVARGSRVPPWPAFAAWNTRRTAPTAWVEVMPTGLSRMTQPSTFSPRRLPAIGFAFPGDVIAVVIALGALRLLPILGRILGLGQVTGDGRAAQQLLDPIRLAESEVGLEADGGRHPEFDGIGERLAEIAGSPVEGTGQGGGVAA